LVPNPVEGGNFTCRIPASHAHLACIHDNGGHGVQAVVYVDKVKKIT
jgi:hypothetical protein